MSTTAEEGRSGPEADVTQDSATSESPPELTRPKIPTFVWWVTALHVTVLLAYSLLLPTYQAPDEPQHTDLAHLFSEELRYPPWDGRYLDGGIVRSYEITRFEERSRNLTAPEAPPGRGAPAIEDLADESVDRPINHMSQHPPLYYALSGGAGWLLERVIGDPMGSFVFENWFYRLVSVALVAPLPVIIWQVAWRLRLPEAVTAAATLVPFTIPQLFHNGSTVNNDSLMWLFFWLLTPVVLQLAGGDLRPRTAVLAGALTGLALLTKGFAIILPLWVLAAVLLAARRGGRTVHREALRTGLVYLAVSITVGGWWWARNLALHGQLSPSRFRELHPGPGTGEVRLGVFLREWLFTTRRFWGDFGWYFVARIPDEVIIAATVVIVVALAFACRPLDRVAGVLRGNRLLLAAPLVLLVLLQGANSLRAHLQTGRIGGMQGRYWFGALAALAVVVALGLANLARRHRRALPLAILVAAAAMHLVAVRTILGYHWGPVDGRLPDQIRAMATWAPLPDPVLILLAVTGGVALAAVVLHAVRFARPHRSKAGSVQE